MFAIKHLPLKSIFNQRYFSFTTQLNKASEVTKIINPNSNISIRSGFNIRIKPYDIHDCPDSNKIRASFVTSGISEDDNNMENLDITKEIGICVLNKNVQIEDKLATAKKNNISCLLEVPIKSDLNIECRNNIDISDMYSNSIKAFVHSGSISTKNLKNSSVDISTINGDINCAGLTLAKKIDVRVKGKGNIFLDKLQGDLLFCKAYNGDIKVNSCYVEKSNFSCEKGNLNLKNIHKFAEVFVLKQGNIDMTGIHGNIYINSKGSKLNLQFSEIKGDNIIVANKAKNVIINVSDLVESNSYIELHSDKIELDPSIQNLMECLLEEKHFEYGNKNDTNKIMICSSGLIKLGKMSWADSIKTEIGLT